MTSERAAQDGKGPVGTIVRASGKDGPQRVDSRGHRWTDAAEALFLDELGASCNVKRAALAAGFSCPAIYRRCRTDPVFAERWHAALVQGYGRLEALLIQRANETLEGHTPDPDTPIPPVSVKDAITILQMYRATVTGGEGKRPGWRPRTRSLQEVRGSILIKLEAIEAARRAEGEPPYTANPDG